MTSKHIEGQSQRQRQRPDDDGRHELDRRKQEVHRPGDAGREHEVLEVADQPEPLDADDVEDDATDHGEEQRDSDPRGRRELQNRDDPGDVQRRQEEEHRGQVGDVLDPLLADGVHRDRVTDETVRGLTGELQFSRDGGGAAGGEKEEQANHQRAQHNDEHRLGEERARTEQWWVLEVAGSGTAESAALSGDDPGVHDVLSP